MLKVEFVPENEDDNAKHTTELITQTPLKELAVSGYSLQRETLKIIPIFKCIKHNQNTLETIILDTCHINDAELMELGTVLKGCKLLHTLTLNSNELSITSMKSLADVILCVNTLDTISLGGNFIEDKGLQVLLEIIQPLARPLRLLSVSRNQLTSKSGDVIAKWIAQREVHHLFLSANRLGDAGMSKIAEALPLAKRIDWLSVTDNFIGDPGVRALCSTIARCPTLRRIELDNNIISLYMHDALLGSIPTPAQGIPLQLHTHLTNFVYNQYKSSAILAYINEEYAIARKHFKRAHELKDQRSCGNYLNLATAFDMYKSIAKSDEAERELVNVLQLQDEVFSFLKRCVDGHCTPVELEDYRAQGRVIQDLWVKMATVLDKPKISPWYRAIKSRDQKNTQLYIDIGFDINKAVNLNANTTPLHIAARHSSKKMAIKKLSTQWINWLIAHGATADCVDAAGKYPEDYVTNEKLRNTLQTARLNTQNQHNKEKSWSNVLTALSNDEQISPVDQERVDRVFRELPQFLDQLDLAVQGIRENGENAPPWLSVYDEIRDVYEPMFSVHGQECFNVSDLEILEPRSCYSWTDDKFRSAQECVRDSLRLLDTQSGDEFTSLMGLEKLLADGRVLKTFSKHEFVAASMLAKKWWPDEAAGLPTYMTQTHIVGDTDGTKLKKLIDTYPRLASVRLPEHGESLLNVAAGRGKAACVKVVIDSVKHIPKNLKVNIRTPLDSALESLQSNFETVQQLIAATPDLTYLSPSGATLIHKTVAGMHPQKGKVIRALVDKGVPVDHQDEDGNTALHIALQLDDLPAVKALLHNQASPTIKNNQQKTAHDVALTKQTHTAKYLLDWQRIELTASAPPLQVALRSPLTVFEARKEEMRQLFSRAPSVKVFYKRVVRKVGELLSIAEQSNDPQKNRGGVYISKTVSFLGNIEFVSGPVILNLYKRIQNEKTSIAMDEVMRVFADVQLFANALALQLTRRYHVQLAVLKDRGAEDLADFVVLHIVHALSSGHVPPSVPLIPQLMEAVAYNVLPKGCKLASSFQGGAWTCRGILQHCGIVLEGGKKYRCVYPISKPLKYNFRQGTEVEVEKYNWVLID